MHTQSILLAFLLAGAAAPFGASSVPAAESAPRAAAEKYALDGGHSMVVFRILHLGVSYNYGRFNDVSGSFTWDSAKPEASAIEITVKAESVDTGVADRDNHLRGPDFFDAKQFATIDFKSKKVEKAGEHGLKVTGDLSLHGVTKSITLDVTHVGSGKDPWGGQRIGFETKFTIRRSDYGMNQMLDLLGDEVTLMVGVEGVRQ